MPWQPERSRALSALLAAIALLLAGARLARAAPMVDDDQHTLALTKPAARIISLAPGATAMLFAAGAGAQIVGTSDYSDEPPAAEHIERVGDSRTFDLERILALHPDVIVAWISIDSSTVSTVSAMAIAMMRGPIPKRRCQAGGDCGAWRFTAVV